MVGPGGPMREISKPSKIAELKVNKRNKGFYKVTQRISQRFSRIVSLRSLVNLCVKPPGDLKTIKNS